MSPPRGAARSSHGVEIERVTDGQISLTGETEDCQYGAVEGPRNNISLNGCRWLDVDVTPSGAVVSICVSYKV